MDRHRQTMLFLANRVVGPAFLIVGLLVTIFSLETYALPIVRDAIENGITPRFGIGAITVAIPLLVAYFGVLLIKVKRVSRKPENEVE